MKNMFILDTIEAYKMVTKKGLKKGWYEIDEKMFKIIYFQKHILQEETETFSFDNRLIFSEF